jgi:predicted metal-dependent enzyme (double-stranded beta helix superfamily)
MNTAVASDPRKPQEWHEVTAPPRTLAAAAGALVSRRGLGTLAQDALRGLVEEIAARTDLWQPLVITDAHRRRYRLLYEDPRLDIWILSWMPGQKTGFHDHGNSNVALTRLQGVVLEQHIRLGSANIARELCPGRTQLGPAGYIHSVAHASGEPAVTLHAYSPPLIDVGQYRTGALGQLVRERQHGRQELLDNAPLPDALI